MLLGCGADGGDGACEVEAECQDGVSISVWYPTCVSGVLKTPTGTGAKTCDGGVCKTDFDLVETDCALKGQVCGPNPDDAVQGDACIDT